jgi:crossover junction endodeoxyribonuclease RuvC
MNPAVILGIDPALHRTGWGVIDAQQNQLHYRDSGQIVTQPSDPLEIRLRTIHHALEKIIAQFQPTSCAIEETFVNINASTSLLLGQARGAILLTLTLHDIPIHHYAPTLIKKTVVGAGRAEKSQVAHMVRYLLPTAQPTSLDASDALATALCHAQHRHLQAVLQAHPQLKVPRK